MMVKVFDSTPCSSLRQILRPPARPTDRRCFPSSSVSTATSRFRLPSIRIVGNQYRNSRFNWMAKVGGNVESSAVPTPVPVGVAHELLQAGHRYLDVRTSEEFSAGHAIGAINVPFMFKTESGMTKNPKFLEEAMSHLGKDDKIIVGCQSGKRSAMAVTALVSAGYTGITDVAGGYAAWIQNGLPTEC